MKQARALEVTADCQKPSATRCWSKDNGVSRQDADDAIATCNQDKASVESKKRRWKARVSMNWTTVTAPIAGRIRDLIRHARGAGIPPIRTPRWRRYAARYDVRRSHPIQRRSAAPAAKPREQQRYAQRDPDPEDGSTYSEKGRPALTEVAVDESTGSVPRYARSS